MKKLSAVLVIFFWVVNGNAQGLLNKVKSKAVQEVNKLENGSTASANSKVNTNNRLSPNVTRTVVVSLKDGERFDYSENCIDLGSSLSQIEFVVQDKSSRCFSYRNGIRTATPCPQGGGCATPSQCSFTKLRKLDSEELKKYLVEEVSANPVQMPGMTAEQVKMMESMMTKEQIAEMKKSMAEAQKALASQKDTYISFGGKKYGPFTYAVFYLTSSGKHFYAIVSDQQSTTKVITSTSTKLINLGVGAVPMFIIATPDNTDFASVSQSSDPQKYDLVTASGKKILVPGMMGDEKVWYGPGNQIVSIDETQIYLNGKSIKKFENAMNILPCDVFVAADGKSVTVIVENKISFADGDLYEYPLSLGVYKDGTSSFYKWLALEGNEIVLYKKPY